MRRGTLVGWAAYGLVAGALVAACSSKSSGTSDADLDGSAQDVAFTDATQLDSPLEQDATTERSPEAEPPEASMEAAAETSIEAASPEASPEAAAPEASLEAASEASVDAAPEAAPVGGEAGEAGPTCAVAPAGLVAWWPGNGNANDVVGGDDGAFPGTYVAGEVGQAFSIDANDYVTAPDEAAIDPGVMSVEVWLRHDMATGHDPVVKKSDPSQTNGFAIEFDAGGSNLFFWVYTASGWQATTGVAITPGAWTHVVASYDGTTSNLYANGVLAGSAAITGGSIVPAVSPIAFGRDPANLSTRTFVGAIDEVSLYDRALTPADVASLYAAGSAGKCALATDAGAHD